MDKLSKEKIKKIHISDNPKLNEIPKNLCLFSELEELYLYENNLSELDNEIGNLKKLKVLDLSNNKIKKLPASFSELSELCI